MAVSFVLHHVIKRDLAHVKSQFENLEQFVHLHPLMDHVTRTGINDYNIQERMPYSFFRFRYKTEVLVSANEVIYIAYPFFLKLTISFMFSFSEEEKKSVIKESVHIKGPFPVTAFLKREIISTHLKIIERIRKGI